MESRIDTLIVGGGLAGLAAATYVARAGRTVRLLEKGRRAGGRALSEEQAGARLNLGPRALYRGGPAERVLRELGVPFRGGKPPNAGLALCGGRFHRLPGGPASLLATRLLGAGDKWALARILAGFGRTDPAPLAGRSYAAWVDETTRRPRVREVLHTLARVATYTNAPEVMDAGAAVGQIRRALTEGVLYLDGGWQTLVDGLGNAARAAGAEIVPASRVVSVRRAGAGWGVAADGREHHATHVLLAVSPTEAARLAPGVAALAPWARAAVPVRAACLDVVLPSPPRPRTALALGVDRPLYYSMHSRVADLAPKGTAVMHLLKYLPPDHDGAPEADRAELEALLDALQPGGRERAAAVRFRPRMTVSTALVTARQGGLAGRPGPAVPEAPGLFVAGDWVGPEGLLADAALASARCAARWIVAGVPAETARAEEAA